MKVRRTVKCYVTNDFKNDRVNKYRSFIYLDRKDNGAYDTDSFIKATLTYEEEVASYDIKKFLEGMSLALSYDNDIKELKVSVDFYEALKSHVRRCCPPQANPHGEDTLNVYGVLITKGVE